MRKSAGLMIAAVVWTGSMLGAGGGISPCTAATQNVAGKWLGTIKTPGGELHIAFEISQTAEGGYTAVVHSIDQGAGTFPSAPSPSAATACRLELKSVFTYEGKLQPNGNAIEGNWIQDDSTAVVMKRVDQIPELNRPQTPEEALPVWGGGSGIQESRGECQHCGDTDHPPGKRSVSGGLAHRGIRSFGP